MPNTFDKYPLTEERRKNLPKWKQWLKRAIKTAYGWVGKDYDPLSDERRRTYYAARTEKKQREKAWAEEGPEMNARAEEENIFSYNGKEWNLELSILLPTRIRDFLASVAPSFTPSLKEKTESPQHQTVIVYLKKKEEKAPTFYYIDGRFGPNEIFQNLVGVTPGKPPSNANEPSKLSKKIRAWNNQNGDVLALIQFKKEISKKIWLWKKAMSIAKGMEDAVKGFNFTESEQPPQIPVDPHNDVPTFDDKKEEDRFRITKLP